MKIKILTILLTLSLLLPITAAKAANTRTGNSIYVASNEIIAGNLYAIGEKITIDGNISGDLIALAQTIVVNGRIDGDIIALAHNISVNGPIGGNVRIAGNNLSINNKIARNLNLFGPKVIIGTNSNVAWDTYLIGVDADINGTLNGNLSGQANKIIVNGKIGKNIDLKLAQDDSSNLIIGPKAIINGNLTYNSSHQIDVSKKATIAGKIKQIKTKTKTNNIWPFLWKKLFSVFSALIVGLVLIFISKNITSQIITKLKKSPEKSFLPGILIIFAIPPLSLFLIFTLIGIPLALMLIAWLISIVYIAKIYTAIFVGQLIFEKFNKQGESYALWSLVLGVLILWSSFAIPYVGWFINFLAISFGLGGVWFYMTKQLKNN